MPFHLESPWGATLMSIKGCTMNKIVRVCKKSGPVLSRLCTKFMKFLSNVGDPSYFPAPLPDCLLHVSFRRYSPLTVDVVENANKCKFLGHIFSWGTTPTVLQQIVSAMYNPPFGKVWSSSVCWSTRTSATPGNDVESRIYIGWVKMAV